MTETLLIVLCVLIGLVCIGVVGYILFRPVAQRPTADAQAPKKDEEDGETPDEPDEGEELSGEDAGEEADACPCDEDDEEPKPTEEPSEQPADDAQKDKTEGE